MVTEDLIKNDLERYIEMLEKSGIKDITIIKSPPKIKILSDVASLPRLRKQATVLHEEMITLEFKRDTNLLGHICLQFKMRRLSNGTIKCAVKPIGGHQLELFHSPLEAVLRVAKEYQQYFSRPSPQNNLIKEQQNPVAA